MENEQHQHRDRKDNEFLASILQFYNGREKVERRESRTKSLKNEILRAGIAADKTNKKTRMRKKRKKYLKVNVNSRNLGSIKEDENEDKEAKKLADKQGEIDEDNREVSELTSKNEETKLHLSIIDKQPKRPHSVNLPPLKVSAIHLQWKQSILIDDQHKPTDKNKPVLIRDSYRLAALDLTSRRATLKPTPIRLNKSHISVITPLQDVTTNNSNNPKPTIVATNTVKSWKPTIKKLAFEILDRRLAEVNYEPLPCAQMTQQLASELIEQIKKETNENFKVVSMVSIGSMTQEESVQFSSRAHWNTDTDAVTTLNYKNNSLYAAVIVYMFKIARKYRKSESDASGDSTKETNKDTITT